MGSDKQKRSCLNGMEAMYDDLSGVGARHDGSATAEAGGGYLDICTDFKLPEKISRDPRIAELSKVGINGKWRGLASQIGFDAFIVVWNHLSMHAEDGDDGHRVYVPKFDLFMRYQRNRYILALSNDGHKPSEIQRIIAEELGESVHVMHICRLIRQARTE